MGRELIFPGWDIVYVKNKLKEAPNYLKDGGYIISDEGDSWLINNEYRLFLELHTAYRGCVLKIFSEIERIYANSPNPWPPRWEGTKKLYQDYDRSRNDLPMLALGILDMFYPINLGISLNGIAIQQALIILKNFGEWVTPDEAAWRFMYDNHIVEKKCMIFGNNGDERIIIHAHEGAYGTDLSLSSNSTIETLDAFCIEIESHITFGSKSLANSQITDNGHFHYPREKRLEIVRHFREVKMSGQVNNKDAWAQSNYRITGKTLKKYEDEFKTEM